MDDIQVSLAEGAKAHHGVREVGGGKLFASVQDADGNAVGLMPST